MPALKSDLVASSPVSGRRDRGLLSLQRRSAGLHFAHEPASNARYAIAGIAGLALLLLGMGLQDGWIRLGGRATPPQERADEFATTRVGRILLPTTDDETCRELAFYNDTGAFSRGRMVRCPEAITGTIDPVAADANGRALAIRAYFSKQ
jgi:hypothetical protein